MNHKSFIVKSLQEVEDKLNQAEKNLASARNNFQLAKLKAEEIRNRSILLSSQTKKGLLLETDDDIKRLQALSLDIVRLEEENSVSEIFWLSCICYC